MCIEVHLGMNTNMFGDMFIDISTYSGGLYDQLVHGRKCFEAVHTVLCIAEAVPSSAVPKAVQVKCRSTAVRVV